MPKPRYKYLHHERTRHGRWIWYVRLSKGLRIRLYEEFGTDKFRTEYIAALQALMAKSEVSSKRKISKRIAVVVNPIGIAAALPAELVAPSGPPFVYFIKVGNRAKIGLAKNVHDRARTLKTAIPESLEIVHTLPGNRNLERHLHKKFGEWAVGGEWFKWNPVKRFLQGLPLPSIEKDDSFVL